MTLIIDRVHESQRRGATTEVRWQHHTFGAMNTNVKVWFVGDDASAGCEVETLFRSAEQRMSRFAFNSELSGLNRCQDPKCALSDELYAVIEAALWAAAETGGLYDPTVLAALLAAGYDRSFERIVENRSFRWAADAYAPDVRTGWQSNHPDYRSLRLIPEQHSIERPAGVAIDLGGIGKGLDGGPRRRPSLSVWSIHCECWR
ncbi:MAG: FAD:protein FMN transferase [Anaerolineales bacterium]|nr:FAD:protein FMN transferase [Anaerolineales bacterium]